MEPIHLGKSEDEAIAAFALWKTKVKSGNPHCSRCHGTRGWDCIRTIYTKAHDFIGYELVFCCAVTTESELENVRKELEEIRRVQSVILHDIAVQLDNLVSLKVYLIARFGQLEKNTLIGFFESKFKKIR